MPLAQIPSFRIIVSTMMLATPALAGGSLLVGNDPVGKTPRHLGYNAEMLNFIKESNMADWMADSNGTICRIFTPKRYFKTEFDHIKTEEDFNQYRIALLKDPDKVIQWDAYRLNGKGNAENSEKICDTLLKAGVQPLVSINCSAKDSYPQPILVDLRKTAEVPQNICWAAATAAYEIHFATFYRLGKMGVRYFTMGNEPEYGWTHFHYPADVVAEKLPWNERCDYIGRQLGAIAKMGRFAMNDANKLLSKDREALHFTGPGAHTGWEIFWKYTAPYVDTLDSHCYDPNGQIIASVQDRMAMRNQGKSLAFSEFNLVSGPMTPYNSMFTNTSSLLLAGMLQSLLQSTSRDEPNLEFATLYLFNYPATHRMFKSLVYGDMDVLDAAGTDQNYQSNLSELAPTLEGMQIRTATTSYFVFKMLARCVPGSDSSLSSYEVLPLGMSTLGFSQAVDSKENRSIYLKLERDKYHANGGSGNEYQMSAIRTEDRLYVNIANPGPGTNKDVEIDLGLQPKNYRFAVVRQTSEYKRDEVVAIHPVKNQKINLEIPGSSFIQVILVDLNLDNIQSITLEEQTFTPGTIEGLSKLETSRLIAIGNIDGKKVDLSELNIEWKSNFPPLVRVYSSGLVQRLYESRKEVTITASVLNSKLSAEAKVRPSANAKEKEEIVDGIKLDVGQDKMIREQAKDGD